MPLNFEANPQMDIELSFIIIDHQLKWLESIT